MLNKLFHIILALLFFISSTGFVINKHYCQNELKSLALFVEAKACHQEKKMRNCPFHNSDNSNTSEKEEKKGCCNDKTEYVKTDQDQLTQSSKLDLQLDPVLIDAIFIALRIEGASIDTQTLHYLNYKPPLIVCDLPIRLQTFRC